MSAYHRIFVASEQPAPVPLADLAAVAGGELTRADGALVDYGVGVERAAVEVEPRHGFEDDYGIPFAGYRVVVTVRDYDRDPHRQEEPA